MCEHCGFPVDEKGRRLNHAGLFTDAKGDGGKMRRRSHRYRGFSLLELLIFMAVVFVVFVVVVAVGWGLAFTFSAYVLVPFLNVPEAWFNAVTVLCSVLLTGVSSVLVIAALLFAIAFLSAFFKRKRR